MNRDHAFLNDILHAIGKIESYTKNKQSDFIKDQKTQDAVIRNIEIIGEAVKNLSEELKNAHPAIPWRKIAGMRDRLIHEYFRVDIRLAWTVVQKDLPSLKTALQKILKSKLT